MNRKEHSKLDRLDSFWAYNTKELPKNKQLLLLDNVQFIYELALAQLELQSLGTQFEVTNGLREFRLLKSKNTRKLRKKSAYFKIVKGNYTDYFKIIQKNRKRSVNQYLTHWIYPYKGKFHPQMIRALLNIIGLEKGDTVLDPFIGSGTTAVEAQLLGINCVGVDISPLCVLQSKVKTESISVLPQIEKWKKDISNSLVSSLFTINNDYNTPKDSFKNAVESIPDDKVKNFYKMAKLVAISDNVRRRRNFSDSFLKNLELMIASVKDYNQVVSELSLDLGTPDIKIGDSRALPIDYPCIDGIITSPPYSIALDYVKNDEHSLRSLNYNIPELKNDFIGVRGIGKNKIELYNEDVKKSYSEMYRVLKPNKFAVIVIGDATYQGEKVKTVQFTIDSMEKIGFTLAKNMDKLIYGLYNVMLKESILIFKKEV